MSKKILFTDLDGTLLDSKKDISKRTLDTIRDMIAGGHHFAFVTGRPLPSALEVAEHFGFMGDGFYVAAFNGGQIYDCAKRKVITEHRMPMEYATFMFKAAHDAGLHVHTYTDDCIVCKENTPELKFYTGPVHMEPIFTDDITKVLDKGPLKIIVMSLKSRQTLIDFRDSMLYWTDGKLCSTFSHDALLEYALPVTTKGNAVRFLAEHLGVDIKDTIACGDEENDITMIDAAGVGVVMKNGNERVKLHADYVTMHTNDEDGMCEIIDKFVK